MVGHIHTYTHDMDVPFIDDDYFPWNCPSNLRMFMDFPHLYVVKWGIPSRHRGLQYQVMVVFYLEDVGVPP